MPNDRDRAFDRLLREHGPALARLVRCYAQGEADREDLMQDIAFALWRALPSFRHECSERTFVYRVAHNRGLSYRSRTRRHTLPLDAAPQVPDARPLPDAQAHLVERRSALWTAVRALPLGLQQVVMLRLEGLADREIADVIGISENNVAVRLTRARHQLRQRLGESSA